MSIFISHIAEEKEAATALKKMLEQAIPQLSAWVSSLDIKLGEDWMAELARVLKEATAIIALCSAKSLERPWVNFESGFGAGNFPVIPVCHAGLGREQLPLPLSRFQGLDLREADDCRQLVQRLAQLCGISEVQFDADEMVERFSPRATARTGRIGISLAHGQDQWPLRNKTSLFEPRGAGLDQRWKFRKLLSEDRLIAAEMLELSGLILGSPFRATMSANCMAEIEEWVHAGGRLLLLGYELGDRHHDANLGTLAQRFGLHPMADIVGPAVARGGRADKPYGKEIALDPAIADPHDLTRNIDELRLANLQTVMLDPDATAWLKIGRNAIYRVARGTVIYEKHGTFASPKGQSWEVITGAPWIPVAAEAPSGLCGHGGVHFIGTWDLLPPQTEPVDQRSVLLERLLDWLAGKNRAA